MGELDVCLQALMSDFAWSGTDKAFGPVDLRMYSDRALFWSGLGLHVRTCSAKGCLIVKCTLQQNRV